MKKILLAMIVFSLFPVSKVSNFNDRIQSVSSVCLNNKKNVQNSSEYTPFFNPDQNGNVNIIDDDGQEITFNVVDELNEELEYYKERWECEPHNRNQISCLIDALTKDIERYNEYIATLYGSNDAN